MKTPNHSHVRAWIIVLIGLLCIQIQHAQTGSPVKVQGKILDTNQVEITGAVVKVQNRAVGTATDLDGQFALEANVGETLEISYIGYKKQYIKVAASQHPLTIILEEDSIELENIVVVGYGTTRKEKLTGAVATVSTDDFKNRPINDVSLALQGKVAGIQVTQRSG
ncbi:MAG: carboxypeptidase-like regulatory domain-containing protein [Tannerellaceae bacterium]|nr:carboxypeptidase-like regulatory domain-containing protein [Tannerellaceae bacterium]